MYSVYYLENRNILLSQLCKSLPTIGENITIKGRKGKVSNVTEIGNNRYHVEVSLEIINKNKVLVDNSKKKKGK